MMLLNIEDLLRPSSNKDLSSAVNELMDNGEVFYTTNGQWSLHDQMEELLKHYSPAVLYMSTFSITEFPARTLSLNIDNGKIRELHTLLDQQFQNRYPKVDQLMNSISTSIGYASVHAKILVIESEQEIVTVLGSANWTINPRLEAGVMTRQKSVGEGLKKMIIDLINNN